MDFSTIATAISNLGFPIAVCVYLFYSNEKLRQSLDNNTKTIESLKDAIKGLLYKEKEM